MGKAGCPWPRVLAGSLGPKDLGPGLYVRLHPDIPHIGFFCGTEKKGQDLERVS